MAVAMLTAQNIILSAALLLFTSFFVSFQNLADFVQTIFLCFFLSLFRLIFLFSIGLLISCLGGMKLFL